MTAEDADHLPPPGETGELAPELANLAGLAAAADAQVANADLPPGAQPPAPIDKGQEFAAMITMAVAVLSPALPFLAQCYPPPTCEQIGIAFGAVADKRGWSMGALSSPELALAVVAVPPTITAFVLGKAHFAAKRAEEAIAKAQATSREVPELVVGDNGGVCVAA
jgi:hypothetical protein